MNITIPVYVEELNSEDSSASVYMVRPLFYAEFAERSENLSRAMNKLVRTLKQSLDAFGRMPRHDALADLAFCPEVEDHLFKFKLQLKQRVADGRFLIVAFEDLGRRLAFSPSFPDIWFDVARGEALFDRAQDVLASHFRRLEKEEGEEALKPEDASVKGKAWVAALDLDIRPQQIISREEDQTLAILGGEEVLDGEGELNKVGRCLDWLYPEELSRAVCRNKEVEELTRLLSASDKRPVLVMGPRMVGKTAIIHEYVYKTVEKRRSIYASKNNVWLLSPQRLISGMSYVGQWENRLLAILKKAKKQNHILYFDDLLGLFHAGATRDSKLCVLDVLKPYVERREFRALAEITPEAFRVLQEKDRGFADLFQILPVGESSEDETLQILIGLIRELEKKHGCRFDLDALPTALDIQRRYVRDAVFPGKAASFLAQLAVKFRNSNISRKSVFEEFQAKSGLSVTFLDVNVKLDRPEAVERIGREVIGQKAALNAAADVICIAKARLNDPDRPLASFLFLGPTGVGKTQCAKSLAAYLFGDADKILRFDMNEYVSSGSTARLVGTFDNPEGLLTSAVRRQPFSVVLLDEIEKADPDVFNLLLQVMGDGRLTDAMGRTADFTNTILIMTSNLGVKEASGNLGFHHNESGESSAYVAAAEKFFKPEFFNRLDRIVPFDRLRREDVQKIAVKLIQDVFARDGLMRRKCILQVDERAMEKIVDQGYHPLLGARALKRAVERQLTQPVASRLASMSIEAPTIISLYPSKEGIEAQVQALAETAERRTPLPEGADLNALIDEIEKTVERIENEAAALRPEGAVETGNIQPEHFLYFTIKDQARRVRNISRRAAERLMGSKRSSSVFIQRLPHRAKQKVHAAKQSNLLYTGSRPIWKELTEAQDYRAALQEAAFSADPFGEKIEEHIAEALRETALLKALVENADSPIDQAILYVRTYDESKKERQMTLARLYAMLFGDQWGFEVSWIKDGGDSLKRNEEALAVKGRHALKVLKIEEGTHLFLSPRENFTPVQVTVQPVVQGTDPVKEDPFKLLPVIRIYDESGVTADLRTGLMSQKTLAVSDLRAFILTALNDF